MSRGRPTIDEKFLHTYSQPPLLGPHKLTLLSADLDTSPALTNVSTKQTKTKNLHQVFYQFSNFSDNLCGGGRRGAGEEESRGAEASRSPPPPWPQRTPPCPDAAAGKFLPKSSFRLRNIPPTPQPLGGSLLLSTSYQGVFQS